MYNIRKFAEENAGQRVRIINIGHIPNGATELARVIGHNKTSLVVEFEEQGHGWRIEREYGITFVVNNAVRGWYVPLEQIELVKPLKEIKPYPHTCKICKAPSRKNGSIVLCSNVKCKATNKKRYVSAVQKRDTYKRDTYIRCPVCKGIAASADGRSHKDGEIWYSFVCMKDHRWQDVVYPYARICYYGNGTHIYFMPKDLSKWVKVIEL